MGNKKITGISALIMAVVLCGALSVSGQNTLTLNVGQATYTIQKSLYGGLMEDFGRDIYTGLYVGTASTIPNTRGMRNDIINGIKEAGLTCLEWPGGCAVWNYNWRSGIGPQSSRGGDGVSNHYALGTSEYFYLNQLINGDPYITCNMNASNTTPAEMAAWLNYIADTVAWKNSLKYWKFGNEEWGGCGTTLTASAFCTQYLQFANAVPASYSGKLIRIADGGQDVNWLGTVMTSLAGKMEAVSRHYYAVTDWNNMGSSTIFDSTGYYNQLKVSYSMESIVSSYESTMLQTDPNYKVGLFIDEWGAWYSALPGYGPYFQQSTVRDAVIAVQNLNIFNNHCRRVTMALSAQPTDAIFSLFLTKNPSTTSLVKTPTFYVYKMLKPHQNAKMIPATLNCGTVQTVPVISASASIDSLKAIHISLGNMSASANQTLAITLNNMPAGTYQASGEVVNGPASASHNGFDSTETVNLQTLPSSNYTYSGTNLSVTLPAHSAVMMTLTPLNTSSINSSIKIPGNGISITALSGGNVAINLASSNDKSINVRVFSSNGRLIKGVLQNSITAGKNRIVWHSDNCPAGVYLVRCMVEGSTISERVVLGSQGK